MRILEDTTSIIFRWLSLSSKLK